MLKFEGNVCQKEEQSTFNGSWRGSCRAGETSDGVRILQEMAQICTMSCDLAKNNRIPHFYSIFSLPDKSQLTSLYLLKCFSEASVGFNIETFSCFSDFSPEKMSLVISEISVMNSNVSHINPIKTFKDQMIWALISPLFL